MNKTIVSRIVGLRIRPVVSLILASLLLGVISVGAGSSPFSRIVVFGDSLSDTGNFHRLTGGVPGAPYASGRFSNGPLWIEYLAEDLGMTLLSENNYAVGGATTGSGNSNDGFLGLEYPGLQDQWSAFLADLPPGGADPEALYVVWAGANDFFVALQTGSSPTVLIGGGVANTARAIQVLWAAGARHILVPNVPDLGLVPFGRASGMSAAITQLSAAYNQALEGALQALADSGIPTIRVDAFEALRAMVNSPAEFGFTNVTEAFLVTGGDAAGFLFWDAVHPTTRGHEILADAARERMIDYYSARQGKGLPTAAVHSLNGLVRSDKAK
jgi:thermolabile hemolysin